MGNSFYIQVSPYLLLEYTYGDNSSTYLSSQVKLSRIKNAYLNGQCQLLNGSASENVTQNVLDTSAANLGGFKWVFLDKDVPVPYINTDSNLTYTDLSGLLTSLSVTYDRVRLHIVSGYRLEDLQGLIIQIYGKEAMTQNISVLANNVYLNSDSRDVLNPRPIFMGDRMYDRYVEVLVPSLKGINDDFFANPTNPVSIGYQYTSDNKGFLFNSLIYAKVFEINQLEKKNGITFMYTSGSYEVALNPEDMYAALSARIQEATDGDYFEYFPTYAGNFIEDFISDLNAAGGDYVVINDIDVYEQVGTESLLTASFTQVQMGNYDEPLLYRPVLKYADSAVAFSIDYSIRVYNRLNGFQLIRRSSVTSFNPRKYGKQLDKITLAQQSFPFRVYNKVYGNPTFSFIGNEYASSFSTVYIPVFYETANIVVQSKTLLANGTNPVSTNFYQTVNFGQGDARIYISDFDTYVKFTVSQVDPKNGAITPIDLTAGNVSIAFKDVSGNMVTIPAEPSDNENMKSDGEIVFKVPGTLKKTVLTTDSPGIFYIVSESEGSPETLIYSGSVDDVKNISKEPARAKDVVTAAQSLSSTQSSSANIAIKTTTGETTSSSTGGLQAAINSSSVGTSKSLLQTLTEANSSAVDSIKSTPETKPAVIPNFSFDTGASSIKTGLKPTSSTSESISQSQVQTTLSQGTGNNTNIIKDK
jgi:hypothetical protein